MCLPCAESQELPNGDITRKLKANSGIRRDAANATAAEYKRLYSNVDNSIRAHAKALAVAKTNITVKLAAIQAKNTGHDITASIFVASKGHGHLVLHKGRESSLHCMQKGKSSIVKVENHDRATYWRNINPNERKTIGLEAIDIYDATTSKILQIVLNQDVLPDNVMLLCDSLFNIL